MAALLRSICPKRQSLGLLSRRRHEADDGGGGGAAFRFTLPVSGGPPEIKPEEG